MLGWEQGLLKCLLGPGFTEMVTRLGPGFTEMFARLGPGVTKMFAGTRGY